MSGVVGIGVDIIEIARVARAHVRFGDRLWARLFTPDEQRVCLARRDVVRAFAARFAAKEAVIKALAPERPSGIPYLDIAIVGDGDRPRVILAGAAATLARRRRLGDVMVSLSHERHYAVACAVALL